MADNDPPITARSGRSKRGIADTSKRWPDGVVNVAIDVKDTKSKALIIKAIREWAQHTPALQFRIVSGREGDIRISDDKTSKGNWSYFGTDANNVPADKPTLHLEQTDDDEGFSQNALHEFGHALGLKHEHQHPEHDINWNKQAVYRRFEGTDFDREKVYDNFFKLPTGDELLVTGYDSKSVMHYFVHPDSTKDGRGVPTHYSLSEGDKNIIRRLYTPGRFQSTPAD
jgi:hypothetical protein